MKLTPGAATSILDSSNEAIVVVNNAGDIVYVNHKAEQLFAYDDGEMIGHSVESLMPDAFRRKHKTAFKTTRTRT